MKTRSRNLAMFVLIFASFMDLMDATVVNVALPSMAERLHASAAALEWIVSGYTLAFALLLITGGRLGDVFGRQRLFVVGVAGFTLTSLTAALAADPGLLVGSRVLQGGFAALMVPQVLASVQALYAPKERAAVFGVIGAVTGLAAIAGPLVGGSLVSANLFGWHWRSIFLINVPIGIALIVAALVWVPNTRSTNAARLDLRGVVVATVALGLLVYPLVEGRDEGWPAWIWVMLALSPVAFGAFVVLQRREERAGRSPLVPLRLFSHRGFSAGVLTQFGFMAAMTGFFLVLTLFLQLGLSFSAIGAGLVVVPFSVGAFVGSSIGVPLAGRVGKPMVFVGAAMQAGAIVWVRQVVTAHATGLSGWDLLWPLGIAGLGLGLFVIPLVDLTLAAIDVRDAGAGSGVFNTFQQVGGALGIAVAGVVFFNDDQGLRHALLSASWVAVIGYALAALGSLALPPTAAAVAHEAAVVEPDGAEAAGTEADDELSRGRSAAGR